MVFLSVKVKDTSKLSGVKSQQKKVMFLHFLTEELTCFHFTQIHKKSVAVVHVCDP